MVRVQDFISPVAGAVLGAAYGLLARWLTHEPGPHPQAVVYTFTGVSLAFLFLVPFGLGVLSAALYPRDIRYPWLYWGFMPCLASGLLLIGVLALAWEGAICIVMAAPVVLAMSMMGGLTVGLVLTLRGWKRMPPSVVASCLVLPFAFGPVESRLPPADDLRTVTTVIDVAADPATVWRNVVRVPLIRDEEQTVTLFQRIGIPRPLEATLSGEGVGALREARFAGGIRFLERVTEWEPERQLGFTITAEQDSIAADVLDAHVRVGGSHFDVVYGRFVLEPRGPATRLVLESRHHVRTHLNFYAQLWTDAVMRDIQGNICEVIRRRSEGGVSP
jgi:hypothetical protein